MSGHSHWATIRRKKEATDAKKGAVYTRLAREIVIAAREGGGDPGTNVRLQLAIERARAQNMPKDNIERAIRRGSGEGKDGVAIEEVMYEGYGPHGIALLIACVTDNRNRSVAEIRHALNKAGGSMAEAGSVAWQFKRIAYFSFPMDKLKEDEIFEMAVEAGADDVIFEDGVAEIIAPPETYKEISVALHNAHIVPEEAELRYTPNNEIELGDDDGLQVLRMVENLEELDDIQSVFSNLAITDSLMARMED